MKIKESLKLVLPFIVGFTIFGIIFDIVSNIGLLSYWNLLKPEHFFISKTVKWIFSILSLGTMIVGGILGIKSYKKKNEYFEIFNLTKPNLITNLIVVLVANVVGYLTNPFPFDYKVLTGSLIWFVIFYPFSAILHHLIYNFKKTKNKVIIILLLIIVNPIFLLYSTSMNISLAYAPEVPQEECGVIIQGFTENTVFTDSSVVGKQINSVNGVSVVSVETLMNELNKINSEGTVEFDIEGQKYSLNPTYDSTDQKYKFGFYPVPKMCNVNS